MTFRFDETKFDFQGREQLAESTESAVVNQVGKIPLDEVLTKFAFFLRGCGYNIDKINVGTDISNIQIDYDAENNAG